MSALYREYIQCPDCGAMIKGRGKDPDAALARASDTYLSHTKGGCFDVSTRNGLEAALKKVEELLPGVTLTLSHSE